MRRPLYPQAPPCGMVPSNNETPIVSAGTAVWNDQKLETPNLVLVNDTLVIFYSSTGCAFSASPSASPRSL